MGRLSDQQTRAALGSRLRARRPEIEQAMLARLYAVAEPPETADPEYLHGMGVALEAALDFALAALESGPTKTPPLPYALLSQARLAARNGVSLDTVLRRYFSGFTLFGNFVLQEADAAGPVPGDALHRLLQSQVAQFDHLVAAVTEAFAEEEARGSMSGEDRRAARIKRLLDGELVDTAELSYNFEVAHLGLIATGPGAEDAVRNLAQEQEHRCLTVRRDEGTVWAWLGGREVTRLAEVERRVSVDWADQSVLAIGEPAAGLNGWRLTHHQARAALSVALHRSERIVRYAEVALLASILQDDLLNRSLRQLYLSPLESERDGGDTARSTLRAYFKADRNVSSAAAALGVSRQAVAKRLRIIEDRIGKPLSVCGTELEAALLLQEVAPVSAPYRYGAVAR